MQLPFSREDIIHFYESVGHGTFIYEDLLQVLKYQVIQELLPFLYGEHKLESFDAFKDQED